MTLKWKKIQKADDAFTGDVTGTVNGTAAGTIKTGAAAGATANQDSTATILGGNLTGSVDGTAVATVKSGAADGVNAKSAVDGNAAITMVGGSIAVPSTADKQFEVDTNGNVKVKGTVTIDKDGDDEADAAGLTLNSGTSGYMKIQMTGANPSLDMGGSSPLGTCDVKLRRGTIDNGCTVKFYDDDALKYTMGYSSEPDQSSSPYDMRTVWRMHPGNIYDSDSADGDVTKFAMSVAADSKIGFLDNEHPFAGVNIGGNNAGTIQGLKINKGGLVANQLAVTCGSTTTFDFKASTNFSCTVNQTTELAASNLSGQVGQTGVIVLTQDGTGGRAITLPAAMLTPRGDTISFETGANSISILSYYIHATDALCVNYMGNFS